MTNLFGKEGKWERHVIHTPAVTKNIWGSLLVHQSQSALRCKPRGKWAWLGMVLATARTICKNNQRKRLWSQIPSAASFFLSNAYTGWTTVPSCRAPQLWDTTGSQRGECTSFWFDSHSLGDGERTGCKVVQLRNPSPKQDFRELSQKPSPHIDGDHASDKKHFEGAESTLVVDSYTHQCAVHDMKSVAIILCSWPRHTK